ncbi:dTDP-4-dehydrorhamnose reductase [Pelistega europaea]|uniref:dTDP-4-dehydrorhamnose reductase n=1 Tax=Pelistega europaea TaxID=106147 RepID=A0A7Y4P5L1_9BURK|nr:dTDP-4-dehydrorhamnose reductase [Pelistega europaea]NOL49918.1 dTDP-4-dehydrorhamnose reductase [Pelistega europaea]
MIRVLLTGAGGQVGRCFQDRVPPQWEVLALTSAELDITHQEDVRRQVFNFQPDVIVNAAAYTNVEQAEKNPVQAFAVNADGVHYLALVAEQVGARLFHLSTDYVFDGNKRTPYQETDTPNPLNVYGHSKLVGEQMALAYCKKAVVLRTSWVFSEYGQNFVKTMLRLGREQNTIHVVDNQWGCPTYAGDVADIIIQLIQQDKILNGLYHYCGNQIMTWYEFAQRIFTTGASIKTPHIIPISSNQYSTIAARPQYSVLSMDLLANYWGSMVPDSTILSLRKVVSLQSGVDIT